MNKKTEKLVQCLFAELISAMATKEVAQASPNAEDVFYAACDRIRELNDQIANIAPIRKGYRCPNTAALVAANID